MSEKHQKTKNVLLRMISKNGDYFPKGQPQGSLCPNDGYFPKG